MTEVDTLIDMLAPLKSKLSECLKEHDREPFNDSWEDPSLAMAILIDGLKANSDDLTIEQHERIMDVVLPSWRERGLTIQKGKDSA